MERIVFTGGTHTLDWEDFTDDLRAVEVQREATLVTSKYIFDRLMTLPEFTSAGMVEVSLQAWNRPDDEDFKALLARNTVRAVNFQGAAENVHNLVFPAHSALAVGFQGGIGTAKSDKISVKKSAHITLGTAGYTLNLDTGKNTVTVQSNANFTLNCDLYNVASITVASGKAVRMNGGKEQLYTVANFAGVTFTDSRKATIELGNFVNAAFGDIVGGSKQNILKIGHDSTVQLAMLSTLGATQITVGNYSELTGGNFALSARRDKFTVKEDASVTLGKLDFGAGKDIFTVGKWSQVSLENLNFGDDGNKLTVGDYATLNVTGKTTFGYDTVKVGKYATVTLKAEGNIIWYRPIPYIPIIVDPIIVDPIVIDPYPIHILTNQTENAAGAAGWIEPILPYYPIRPVYSTVWLKNFTLAEGATAYLSTELASAVTKQAASAKVYDIGVYETALNFTNIRDEKSDNALANAREITGTYNGWLSGQLDRIDFVQTGEAATLTWEAEDGLELKLYDADGIATTVTESTVDVTGYAAFSLEIKNTEPVSKCYKYTAALA